MSSVRLHNDSDEEDAWVFLHQGELLVPDQGSPPGGSL